MLRRALLVDALVENSVSYCVKVVFMEGECLSKLIYLIVFIA